MFLTFFRKTIRKSFYISVIFFVLFSTLLTPTPALAQTANHLVISEIQTKGASADDEFIEIYNPTSSPINLSTLPLKLHIINSSGTDQNRALTFVNTTIPAYGFFLIGPSIGYTGTTSLDATYSSSGTKLVDNGAVYISTSTAIDKTGLLDLVGFGSASTINREGTAVSNPAASTSIERKATSTSTVQTMNGSESSWGNSEDSGDNNSDFLSRSTPEPQNSSSAIESVPPIISNGSFETSSQGYPTNWQKRSSITNDSSNSYSGNNALKVFGPANLTYTFQHVTLQPNTKYTLSAWIKTQNVIGKGISLRFAQLKPTTQVFDTGYWVNGTSDWKQIKIIFVTPSNYQSGRVDIIWEMQSGDVGWIDDIDIEATPNATLTLSPANALIENASFESTYINNNILYPSRWWQRANAYLDSTITFAGSNSLKLVQPNNGLGVTYSFQGVILEPNTTYNISAWVKTQNVTGKGVYLRYAQLYPSTKIFATNSIRGTSDWQKINTTFATPINYQAGRLDIIWDFQNGDVGWIDDISFTKVMQ